MAIRDQLTRKALLALDELVDQAKAGPIAPSFAIRFALAYLYVCGKGERWPHDTFWREMQQPDPEWTRESHRPTAMRSALNGIMRQAGIEPTFEAEKALRDARAAASASSSKRGATAQRRMTAAIRDEAALRRAAEDEKRKAKDCGWL